jgi:hypothetical protein
MTTLILWALAVSVATLILTHGSIFAWLRNGLPEGKARTLVHCPMCSGFWFGVLASLTWFSPAEATMPAAVVQKGVIFAVVVGRSFVDGCAGAVLSAVVVSLWILLGKAGNAVGEAEVLFVELTNLANLRRYQESMPPTDSRDTEAEKAPPGKEPDPGGEP